MFESLGISLNDYKKETEALKSNLNNLKQYLEEFDEKILSRSDLLSLQNTSAGKFYGIKDTNNFTDNDGRVFHSGFDTTFINLINLLNTLHENAKKTDLTRILLLDAQKEMAEIERSKASKILAHETGLKTSLFRGLSRAISIVFIAAALLVVGWLAAKFDLTFPNIPIIRIGS